MYVALMLVALQDPVASSLSTVQVVSVLIGTLLPIVVGLVTTRNVSPGIQAVILAALSAVSAFVTEAANSADFVWQQALLTTVVTFVTAVSTHYGLWKPTGVSARALAVGAKRHQRP